MTKPITNSIMLAPDVECHDKISTIVHSKSGDIIPIDFVTIFNPVSKKWTVAAYHGTIRADKNGNPQLYGGIPRLTYLTLGKARRIDLNDYVRRADAIVNGIARIARNDARA